jgi:hypothetical protein
LFPLPQGYDEIYLCCGRQGGKSTVVSYAAAWTAVFGGFENRVQPGATFEIFSISNTREQARIVFRSVLNFLGPFHKMIRRQTSDSIELANGCRISVKASDYHSVRGFGNLALAILDECEFFPGDNIGEVINALTPALTGGGKLIGISSRNGNRGTLQNIRNRFWGVEDSPTLVWMADTRMMNPTYSEAKIAKDIARDARMAREYDPFARADDTSLFSEDKIRLLAMGTEMPPQKGMKYAAFIDTSAGAHDAMVCAIAHAWEGNVYLDIVISHDPPFDFIGVADEFAELLKRYGISECWGDRYAFSALESHLRRHLIALNQSKPNSTDFYLKLKALMQANAVVLLNDKRLIKELARLELVTTPSGAERVEHPKNFTDDSASAAAGAIYHVCKGMDSRQPTPGLVVQRHEHPDPLREKELQAKDELPDCEREMMEYIADGGGLAIPLRPAR